MPARLRAILFKGGKRGFLPTAKVGDIRRVYLMNHFSLKLFNIILNLLNKPRLEKDVFNFKQIVESKQWNISTKDIITNSDEDFKNKSIKFSKQTLTDSLDLTFTDNIIHMFFYHKNTSTDPYIVTNAYIFGEKVSMNNIDKLRKCLQLIQ